jgi:catabolite regulation protein CreA
VAEPWRKVDWFALAGELHQVRAEVAVRQVAVPRGSAHDPERVGNLDVVAGITGSAVVVDVERDPDLAGVLEHEVAVGVVEAGTTGGEAGDGDGAVAVVDDRVVPAVDGEDVGVGAAGVQVGVTTVPCTLSR